MKQCPTCAQIYSDDDDFCHVDGAVLAAQTIFPQNEFSQHSGEMPTQFMPRVSSTAPTPAGKGSNSHLYLVIGVLSTALIAILVYLFLLNPTRKEDNKRESAPAVSATGQTTPSTQNVAVPPSTTRDSNNFGATFSPPALSVDGNWSGQLSYGSGSAFSAQASFSDSGSGQVSGRIVWTLVRTSNPQKAGMIGQSATEFVRGRIDSGTRTLTLEGYDVTNSALIITDKYRLTLSPDGLGLSGISYGGKSRGRFSLRK